MFSAEIDVREVQDNSVQEVRVAELPLRLQGKAEGFQIDEQRYRGANINYNREWKKGTERQTHR